MSIAPEKTEVLVFPDNGKVPEEQRMWSMKEKH